MLLKYAPSADGILSGGIILVKKLPVPNEIDPSYTPTVREARLQALADPASWYAHYSDYSNRIMRCTTHYHGYMEIVFVHQGNLHLNIKYQNNTLGPGNIVILAEKTIHSAWCAPEDNARFCVLQMNPHFLTDEAVNTMNTRHYAAFLNYMAVNQYAIIENTGDFSILTELVLRLIHEQDSRMMGYDVTARSYILILLTYLIRHLFTSLAEMDQTLFNYRKIEKAILFIRKYYMKDINMAMAANEVNLTYNHFSVVFHKITGHTFSEYLNHIRVQEFERILINQHKSISAAALEAGFSNVTHFNRVYRQFRKVSPKQYIRSTFQREVL